MERIVYKGCKVCEGKGWESVGLYEEQVKCPDCAFKNGAEAMVDDIRSEFAKHRTYSRAEIRLRLAAIDPANLKQPPLCMCENIERAGHDDACHLHTEVVST